MHVYLHILGLHIPMYGLMIVIGVAVANIVAVKIKKNYSFDINDFIILQAYVFLFAFLFAKILYLFTIINQIEFDKIFDINYLNTLIQGGFVFYGGLIGGFFGLYMAGKIHKIDYMMYLRHNIFLLPLAHAFGRIGCFCAGCCYGRECSGPLCVVFPLNSFAKPLVPLFPIQLLESFILFVLAISLYLYQKRKGVGYSIEIYIVSYSIIRFILEYFRGDVERGSVYIFSTSQIISIALLLIVLIRYLIISKKQKAQSK